MSIASFIGLPKVVYVNVPTTQTWIAFSLLAMAAYILVQGVKVVDPDIIDLVSNLLTLIVGFYFAKASDQRNADRDAMLIAAGTGTGTPQPEGTATITAAADVDVEASVKSKG